MADPTDKVPPAGVPGYWGPDGNWVDTSSTPEERKKAAGSAATAPPKTVQNTTTVGGFPMENAPRPIDETGGGYRQVFDANRDPTRGAESPSGLVGSTPKPPLEYGKDLTGPPIEGKGSPPAAPKPAPPQVLQTGGTSGGKTAGYGVLSSLAGDFGEQEAAMRRERDARTGSDQPPRQTWGSQDVESQVQGLVPQATSGFGGLAAEEAEQTKKFEGARTAMASEKLDQARNDYYKRQELLDHYQQLTDAYAKGAVDPDKWWNDKSVPQKIASAVGSFFLGLGGHPEAALNYANEQIDRSIAIQQGQLERQRVAAGHYQNLYDLALNNTKNVQEAYDFSRAVYLDNVIADSTRALAPYKNDVTKAEIDQYIAMLKQQRDEMLAKFMAKSGGGGGGAVGGQSDFIPLEQGAQVVDGPDGRQYYIAHGGDQIATSISSSERAASEAESLSELVKNVPAPGLPYTDQWNRYQLWVGEVREKLKTIAVLGSAHMGTGGQGNIARMKAYAAALAGPDADPKGPVDAAMSYPKLVGGVAAQISQNARELAQSVRADNLAILQAHNAVPGYQTSVDAHGTGEFKGQGVKKFVFVPSGDKPSAAPQQAPAQPAQRQYGSFKPDQASP